MVLGQKEPTSSKFMQAMKKEEGADLIREETSTSTNTPGAPPVARERVKYVLAAPFAEARLALISYLNTASRLSKL
jgi:hypothetical protein